MLNVLLVLVKYLYEFLVTFHSLCPLNSLKNKTLHAL
jgi:hypothetical protein